MFFFVMMFRGSSKEGLCVGVVFVFDGVFMGGDGVVRIGILCKIVMILYVLLM